MELQLKIIGFLLIALSILHLFFPARFNWKEEFKQVSLLNRQVMYVHTFFIALVIFLIGLLCITSATEIVGTALGKKISFGLAFFWAVRLYFQFFVYSSLLWKGKQFETCVHILFSVLWIYLTAIFIYIAIQ